MTKLEFTYFEIIDRDFTGIIVKIIENGRLVARYFNFDPSEFEPEENIKEEYWENIWENQTEEFIVPDVSMAIKIIESNKEFKKWEEYEMSIHAAGYMVELESGLTSSQLETLISLFPEREELIPFEVSSNNSTIIGFIPASNIEHLEEIIYTLEPVCDDWENEISDGVYETKNQLRIKVLCDETTVRA